MEREHSGPKRPQSLHRSDAVGITHLKSYGSTLDCCFLDDIDAPYVMISDLMKHRMSKPFDTGFPVPDYSLSYKRQILTSTNIFQGKKYTIEFDARNDEIRCEDLFKATDIFGFGSPHDLCSADYSPIVKAVNYETIVEPSKTVFSFKEYNIDLYAYNNTVLVPLAILNNIFFTAGEKTFAYNGKGIFSTDQIQKSSDGYSYYYNSYSTDEKGQPRNQATADFNKNEFFFELNTFFGRKDEFFVNDFRKYAKYLGVYDEIGSTDPVTSFSGMSYLINSIDDLHSGFGCPSPEAGDIYGLDEKDLAVKEAYKYSLSKSTGYRYRNFLSCKTTLNTSRSSSLGGEAKTGFY